MTATAADEQPLLAFIVPVRTVSETNMREHWSRRHRRASHQRFVARCVAGHDWRQRWDACTVHLTRIAPRRLDAGNNAASMKAVQDGICDALGIDDGDPRIGWEYHQRKAMAGEPKEGVLVEVFCEAKHAAM